MLISEADRLTRVVVCTPRHEYFRFDDRTSHNLREAADPEVALRQHDNLKAALADFGCDVVDIPELPGHPNSVFTRDTAVCTGDGYIRLRMGLDTRRGEEQWMSQILESLSRPCVGAIEAPATVEGGDVILAGKVAFVGRSGRTNDEGARQIAGLLARLGYQVRVAEVPDFSLHIGGAMSLVRPEQVLCCRGAFAAELFKGFETIEIDCRDFASGNVITLGDRTVIADAANQAAIEILEARSFHVHALDLSEFAKGTGGPSCLILPVDRGPDDCS